MLKTKTTSKSATAKTTTDHDEIRRWVEERDGQPAAVKATGRKDDPGILRIDFPGGAGEDTLEHISWSEWFEKFEDNQLAAVFQEKTSKGGTSRFFKLVSRNH
jgi:hypothetical protein